MNESVVGPWARDKLDRLRKYLQAYTSIMARQAWCKGFFYIDAFAGTGQHRIRRRKSPSLSPQQLLLDVAAYRLEQDEERDVIAGSPRVALEVEPPFTWYVFVEKSPERIAQLEKLKAQFETRRIVIRRQDCNEYLIEDVARNPKLNWRHHRGLVFLDPYGMQVKWPTIEALGKTGAIEILLNLPSPMAINRLLVRSAKFTTRQVAFLDKYFGSAEWYDFMYRKKRTLFDHDEHEKIEKAAEQLLKWYRQRLRAVFKYVSRAALIRNTKRGPLYYLIHATHNPTGNKIANDVLSAGEFV